MLDQSGALGQSGQVQDPRRTSPAWAAYAREIGHALKRARAAAGCSQRAVATRAGIATQTYQKYEKGESKPGTPLNPELLTLVAVSQALGITIADLLPPGAPDLTVGR
ncbi:helix-turn-helix domain-containing protein [Nocardioides humi]